MSKLLEITNAIFKYRLKWSDISDEDKEKNSFIVNRFLSKMYPEKAMLLNLKSQDPVSAMNMWYYFMGDQHYPKDFWSKSPTVKGKFSEKDRNILMDKLHIDKQSDLDYLIEKYPNLIKDELKWLIKKTSNL
jgi:hypothetical protein